MSVPRLNELSGEAIGMFPDDASDTRANGQAGSHLRFHGRSNCNTGYRDVDDGAAMDRAVGQGQTGFRIFRYETRTSPAISRAGLFLFPFEPDELARQFLARGVGRLDFEQETAGDRFTDRAVEPAKIVKIQGEPVADFAEPSSASINIRNGDTRVVRQGKLRSFPCGSYQFGSVHFPLTATLTASCLRNSSTDTPSPRTNREFPNTDNGAFLIKLAGAIAFVSDGYQRLLSNLDR